MNKKIDYLKLMGIPIWVSNTHYNEQADKIGSNSYEYVCFIEKHEYIDEAMLNLFNRIVAALNWPEQRLKVVTLEQMEAGNNDAELSVAFGKKAYQLACHHQYDVVEVSSLSQMLTDKAAKKHTWLKLKPFVKT